MDINKEEKILKISEDFQKYSRARVRDLSKDELAEYYREKRLYDYANDNILIGRKMRELYYPILRQALKLNRTFIDKQSYDIIGNKYIDTGKPVIFAVTHVGKFDYQIMTEALNKHSYAFAGDPEEMYRTFDGFFMDTSGVIYCDTEDGFDRYIAQNTAVSLLERGTSLMIYPEAIWNLSANLLMLPIFPGVIKMAQEAYVDIIPCAIEQYGDKFLINIGANFVIDNHDTQDNDYVNRKRIELRDIMATLKLEIMQKMPVVERASLGEYSELEKKYQDMRLHEWVDKDNNPLFSMEKIKGRIFREKDENGTFIQSPEEAFSYFHNLKINENNAFMFENNDDSLPASVQEHIAKEVETQECGLLAVEANNPLEQCSRKR